MSALSPFLNPACIMQIYLYLCLVWLNIFQYFIMKNLKKKKRSSSCKVNAMVLLLDMQLVFERFVFSDQNFGNH